MLVVALGERLLCRSLSLHYSAGRQAWLRWCARRYSPALVHLFGVFVFSLPEMLSFYGVCIEFTRRHVVFGNTKFVLFFCFHLSCF